MQFRFGEGSDAIKLGNQCSKVDKKFKNKQQE